MTSTVVVPACPSASVAVAVIVCASSAASAASSGTPAATKVPVAGSTVAVTVPSAVATCTPVRLGSVSISTRPLTSTVAGPLPAIPRGVWFSGEVIEIFGAAESRPTTTRS